MTEIVDPGLERSNAEWRKLGKIEQGKYIQWVADNIEYRFKLGNEKYDSEARGFEGNPLRHAIQEWFDLGLYLYTEMNKQEEEKDLLSGYRLTYYSGEAQATDPLWVTQLRRGHWTPPIPLDPSQD